MSTYEIISTVIAGSALLVSVAAVVLSVRAHRKSQSNSDRLTQIEEARFGKEQESESVEQTARKMHIEIMKQARASNAVQNLIGMTFEIDSELERDAAYLLEKYNGIESVDVGEKTYTVMVKRFQT